MMNAVAPSPGGLAFSEATLPDALKRSPDARFRHPHLLTDPLVRPPGSAQLHDHLVARGRRQGVVAARLVHGAIVAPNCQNLAISPGPDYASTAPCVAEGESCHSCGKFRWGAGHFGPAGLLSKRFLALIIG